MGGEATTDKQDRVLDALRRAGAPMTSRQVRDAAGLRSVSDATRTCRSLERFGLVERHAGRDPVSGWARYSWTIEEEEER